MTIRLPAVRSILTLGCATFLSAGCGQSAVTTEAAIDPGPASEKQTTPTMTYVYECDDDSDFVARIEGEQAWLFLPTGTVSLPHTPSGSGAKYAAGPLTLWVKGEDASLETGGGSRRNCRNNRARAIWEDAKFRGTEFRAVGNEPGWHLEISAGEYIVYVGDYGQTKYRFPTPEPLVHQNPRITTYRVADRGQELLIILEGRHCQDTMSGETFETRVTVVLDGEEFRGCGKALH